MFSADDIRIPLTVCCLLQITSLIPELAWNIIGKLGLNPQFSFFSMSLLKPGNLGFEVMDATLLLLCSSLDSRVLSSKHTVFLERNILTNLIQLFKIFLEDSGLSKFGDVHRYFVAFFSNLLFVFFYWIFRASFQDQNHLFVIITDQLL